MATKEAIQRYEEWLEKDSERYGNQRKKALERRKELAEAQGMTLATFEKENHLAPLIEG